QTMHAFNLAEKYQLPIIVLVDKYLTEGHESLPITGLLERSAEFKIERGKLLSDEEVSQIEDYKRYSLVKDGVSPRSMPGQKGGLSLFGSDEHDERGLYNEESENRTKMMDKRFKKLDTALSDIPLPDLVGPTDAAV